MIASHFSYAITLFLMVTGMFVLDGLLTREWDAAWDAFLHLILPLSKFELLSGANELTTYTFNTGTARHLFCSTCGIKPFARGTGQNGPMVAINIRTLDGIDPFAAAAAAKQFDGKSR